MGRGLLRSLRISKSKLALVVICLLFLITRLGGLTQDPPSLYWDEASIGYNAYSILTTGKDEWGTPYPVHFRAFGEFKLPVYIYTVTLFESVLGLSETAVRLPAVIYALGVVVLTYLLGKKLFSGKVGLVSALIITIIPWYFLISRVGYEANAGLMFFLLGIYLWLNKESNKWLMLVSVVSFILSMYSYNSFRVVTPLTLIYLSVFHLKWADLLKNNLVVSLVSGALLLGSLIQIVRFMLSTSGTNRFSTISIFQGSWSEILQHFVINYLSHFSLNFLFVFGDTNLRSHIRLIGELYWIFLPFLIVGLWYLIRNRNWLPLYIVLVSIIPAAITKESPHALRSISLVPSLSLIIGIGIMYAADYIKKWKMFLYTGIISLFLLCFVFYLGYFYTEYPYLSLNDWQWRYKQFFIDNKDFIRHDHIYISDAGAQPYIFALFYLKYDPTKFRASVSYNPPDKWGFSTVRSFDKFVFLDLKKETPQKGNNLIFNYEDFL